jgi:hypothetical protein
VRNQTNGKKPSTIEIGATGTQIFGNRLMQEDYNSSLQGPESYDEFDKMRLSDGQVKAALTVIKLPLLNADWFVEPASDSAQDREIAERLDKGLKEEMTTPWQAVLRQILLHLDYGSMPFEKCWELREGLVMLRKLAPRLPKSITHWEVDDRGGLQAIVQGAAFTTGWKEVTIPVEKLLVFVNELEGSNWRGISLLRAAWKHWYFKQGLERVQAIAIEKRGVGIDHGILKGEGRTEDRRKELERVLMGLHAHEKGFLVTVDEQTDYKLEGLPAGGVLDPQGAIDYHNLAILRSCITEFLAMGSGSTGSLAMHRDKTSLLMLGLGAIANNIADTTSAHLIRQWVDYNWEVKEYPRMRYSHLEARDLAVFAKAVLDFSNANVLKASPDVQNAARRILDLPDLPPDALEMPEMEPEGLEELPTEQLVAALKTIRAALKSRPRKGEREGEPDALVV